MSAIEGGAAGSGKSSARRWQAPPLVEVAPDGRRMLVQPVAPRVVARTELNTPRQTWDWLWKDTLGRCVPFFVVAWAYKRFTPWGKEDLGLVSDAPIEDALTGIAVGLPLSQISAVFRRSVAPNYKMPTPADQAFQSSFYFLVNAPAEELFFRGVVQSLVTRGLRMIPGVRKAAGPLGWAAATAGYGAYHRLGGWSWKSIAGVTAAGAVFGWLFGGRKRRSIWPSTIAHGFATAGFLSWGDVALYRRDIAKLRRHYAPHLPAETHTESVPAAGQ